MVEQTRSLRPRHSVDYAARTAVSKTPGWLKKAEPKTQADGDTASKENQRPVKPAKQADTTRSAKNEQKEASEPALQEGEPQTAKPLAKSRKRTEKDVSEDRTGFAGPRSRSSRSGPSADQRVKGSSEDTATQNRRSGPDSHPDAATEAQEGPLPPSTDAADVQDPSSPHAHLQGNNRKRKARTAPANNRKKHTAAVGNKRRNTTGSEPGADEPAPVADSGAEAQGQQAEQPVVQQPVAPQADPSPAQQTAEPVQAIMQSDQLAVAPAAVQYPPQQTSRPLQTQTTISLPEQSAPPPSSNFFKLQEDYAALLKSFQDLQNTKTVQMESLIESQKHREEGLVKAAQAAADYYRKKCERLEADTAAERLTELQDQLQLLQQQMCADEKLLLEARAEALAHQEDATQLVFEVAASKEKISDLQAEVHRLSQLVQPIATEDKEVQATAIIPAASAGQQCPTPQPLMGQQAGSAASAQTSAHHGSQAAAVPEQRSPSLHLQEAKAWCPEGAEASAPYTAPEHVPGASMATDTWPLHSLPSESHPADLHHSQGKATPAASGQAPAFLPADYDSPAPVTTGLLMADGTPAVLHQQGLVPYPMSSAASHQRTPLTRFAVEALAQPFHGEGSGQAAAVEGAVPAQGHLEHVRLTGPQQVLLSSQQGNHPGPMNHATAGAAARQLQYPSGSGHSVALAQTPVAGRTAAAQQTVISTQATGGAEGKPALMPVAGDQAMVHLLGLQGVPSADQGFVYTHPESGYVFELRDASPNACDSSDDEAPGDVIAPEPEELEYRPLHLGSVQQVLPYYLCDLVRFDKQQRQKVVGRILDALGKWRAPTA